MDLAGRTIIVTGAASGIGKETVAELRRRGATVLGVDRYPAPDVDEFFEADLSRLADIDHLVERLPSGSDGLCNIAGVAPTQPGEMVLRVNTLALIRLTVALVPTLSDGASIVNLASMAGNGWRDHLDQVKELLKTDWDGLTGFVERHGLGDGPRSYFLSKEAVIVWTMQNRWTWRDREIRMNTVSPGPIETPILPDFLEMLGERAQESVRNMERFGTPADVAPVVAFLLSDEARWFRGANLTPDGGMGAHLALKRHGLLEAPGLS
jgi:NAD(P)-dependent dehydrogenase (short-subunit alcohol dehydrogenase family)